jgi:hypothetical protein
MKLFKTVYCFPAVFLIIFSGAFASALTPGEILQNADLVRSPFESFVMHADITSPQGHMSFEVYSKREKGVLVSFLKPDYQKGRLLLMRVNEPDIWMCMPGTRRPFKITGTTRMIGGVSNGDLARLRWSQDYDAKQTGEDEKSYKLELLSRDKKSTYHRIEILIEKHSFKPMEARAYMTSGKLSKTIYYNGFESFNGKLMSTSLRFIDHISNEQESRMVFSNVRYQEIPENYFSADALPGLSKTLSEK